MVRSIACDFRRLTDYLLGGGYGLSAFDGHVIFLDQCTERLNSVGHKTVVAFLEYGM